MPLSPAEFAAAIGVSRMHVYNLMNVGQLASFKVGSARRIPTSELGRLLGGDSSAES